MAEFKPAPGTESAAAVEAPQSAQQALQAMDSMQLAYLVCLLAVIVAINWRFLGLGRLAERLRLARPAPPRPQAQRGARPRREGVLRQSQ